ncbi:MAG: FKBP-type peptidyl-prolyl cis-trans isomerase [Bacteroidaceae bacterium]|nr:FKBP-type peptidyl-prolyl cis-trans isomerase [Bacteroidaceae bacterium]
MEVRKLLTVALGLLLCVSLSAKDKKKKAKKQSAPIEKVDTVSVQELSYAFGIVQTNGLKHFLVQQMGVDTTLIDYFIQGFDSPELTDNDKAYKALLAGKEIRKRINESLPRMNKQFWDADHPVNSEEFFRGFRSAVKGDSKYSPDSAHIIITNQNKTLNQHWLAVNSKKKGVEVTPSGLQYKVITAGTGALPKETDKVKVNYEGKLINGTMFDSSYQRGKPAEFLVNGVIKGWIEALTMMPVGSKWELYIPYNLAYGERGNSNIPGYSTLIFTVELIEIVK